MTHFFSVGIEECRFLVVTLDFWVIGFMVIAISAVAMISRIVSSRCKSSPFRNVKVDTVKFGLDFPSVTIRVDKREQELAYALWVELGTRKVALPFDEEYDVIVEIYDSWYAFFSMARKLMRDMPPSLSKGNDSLAAVTERILNDGMRPHLTRWQAEFRRWYERALGEPVNVERPPQEIQRGFPGYGELVADLKRANRVLMQYRDTLREIAGI